MRFARNRRRAAWTYSTRGVLWRLHTGSPEFLLGEDRIPDAKKVSYFCLDRASGTPRWESFVPDGGWWSGVETVVGDVALFHGYASPDMPLHRGVTAVSLASGTVMWAHPGARFLAVESDAALVVNEGGEGGSVVRVRPETGAVLDEDETADSSPGGTRGGDDGTEFPRPLQETEIADPGLLAAVREAIPERARRESIVVVKAEDYCVLAFSEPRDAGPEEGSGFRTSVVALGGPGWRGVHSSVTHQAASAMAPEPFFCQKGVLYYVQEHSTLVAVPLRIG